jgi:hypothetical protein
MQSTVEQLMQRGNRSPRRFFAMWSCWILPALLLCLQSTAASAERWKIRPPASVRPPDGSGKEGSREWRIKKLQKGRKAHWARVDGRGLMMNGHGDPNLLGCTGKCTLLRGSHSKVTVTNGPEEGMAGNAKRKRVPGHFGYDLTPRASGKDIPVHAPSNHEWMEIRPRTPLSGQWDGQGYLLTVPDGSAPVLHLRLVPELAKRLEKDGVVRITRDRTEPIGYLMDAHHDPHFHFDYGVDLFFPKIRKVRGADKSLRARPL